MKDTGRVWPLQPSSVETLVRELAARGESRRSILAICRQRGFFVTANHLRRMLGPIEAADREPRDRAERTLTLLSSLRAALGTVSSPKDGEATPRQLADLRAAAATLTETAARLSVALSDVRPARPAAPVTDWVAPS